MMIVCEWVCVCVCVLACPIGMSDRAALDLHAIPSCQVSVYKLLLGQVLHPFGNLQPKANQVFHCWVLEEERKNSTGVVGEISLKPLQDRWVPYGTVELM